MQKFVRFVDEDPDKFAPDDEVGEQSVILPSGPVSFEVELQSDAPRGEKGTHARSYSAQQP